MADYSMTTRLELPYDDAVAKTREALKEEGFGVVTEIDVKKTVNEKLGEDFHPYLILGACNPPFAHKAVSTDPEVGLLMPCNVCVWDNQDGTSTVAAIDVETMFQVVDNPALADVAQEVGARLRRVVDSLAAD